MTRQPIDIQPGDVYVSESGDEYRAVRRPRDGEITGVDMHAGARVVSLELGDVADVYSRAAWAARDVDGADSEPPQPDAAAYVLDALERQEPPTLRALADYALELADHKEYEQAQPVDASEVDGAEQVVDADDGTKGTIVTKRVKCGAENCKTCDEQDGHGPYEYLAYRDDDGKVATDYLGKAESAE